MLFLLGHEGEVSFEGSVRAEGFEPPERNGNRVTAGPTSPSVARPPGVSDRIRTDDIRDHNPAL